MVSIIYPQNLTNEQKGLKKTPFIKTALSEGPLSQSSHR